MEPTYIHLAVFLARCFFCCHCRFGSLHFLFSCLVFSFRSNFFEQPLNSFFSLDCEKMIDTLYKKCLKLTLHIIKHFCEMYMKKYINQCINNILLVSQTSMISIQFISVLVRDRDMNKLGEFQGKKQGHTKK